MQIYFQKNMSNLCFDNQYKVYQPHKLTPSSSTHAALAIKRKEKYSHVAICWSMHVMNYLLQQLEGSSSSFSSSSPSSSQLFIAVCTCSSSTLKILETHFSFVKRFTDALLAVILQLLFCWSIAVHLRHASHTAEAKSIPYIATTTVCLAKDNSDL